MGDLVHGVDIGDLLERLDRYGTARNRATESEPRTLTITDDEALMILRAINRAVHMRPIPQWKPRN